MHVLTDHSALVVLWSQRTERESTVSAHSAASDAHWTSTKAEGTADLVNCGRSVLEPIVVGGSCAQLELFQVPSHKGAKVKAVRAGTVYSTPLAPFVGPPLPESLRCFSIRRAVCSVRVRSQCDHSTRRWHNMAQYSQYQMLQQCSAAVTTSVLHCCGGHNSAIYRSDMLGLVYLSIEVCA